MIKLLFVLIILLLIVISWEYEFRCMREHLPKLTRMEFFILGNHYVIPSKE